MQVALASVVWRRRAIGTISSYIATRNSICLKAIPYSFGSRVPVISFIEWPATKPSEATFIRAA